jgi:hypothetical protein
MKKSAEIIHLVNINEFTVFYFFFLAIIARHPTALTIDPYFPPTRRFLDKIISKLVTWRRASYAYESCPDLDHVREVFAEIHLYNIFGKIESWQNSFFDFVNVDEKIPDYAMAYKHLTCNYVRTNYFTLLLLDQFSHFDDISKIRLSGLLPSTEGAFKAFNTRRSPPNWIKSHSFPWLIFNVVIYILITTFSMGWIISRIRPVHAGPREVLLAADFIGDTRDLILFRDFEKNGQILLVRRAKNPNFQDEHALEAYIKCKPKDGVFGLLGALKAIGLIITDSCRLFRLFCHREPSHFFNIIALPFRRIVLQALFNKYRPTYFWGRDDYNVEHILRRQELHKFGGQSLGINHGFPSYANLFPQWRYISFDRYYSFGQDVYERIYKETWAKNMKVVPVGVFGVDRKMYKWVDMKKPKDMVVFCAVYTGNSTLVEIVRKLALAFPDRTIWLQIKSNYRDFKRTKEFIVSCTTGLDNVSCTTDSPLKLFPKASYAISDASTTVIEALQFGLVSFMADICKIHEVCFYREYPELCINSAETVIRRIIDLEAGKWSYPRQSYGGLVDLSKRPYADIILEDLQGAMGASL